jgi:integrase
MRRQRLTQLFVEQIKAPKAGRVEYPDASLTGFRLVVSHTGAKSWIMRGRFVKGAKPGKLTIGTTVEIPSIADARRLALAAKDKAGRGKVATMETFAAVAERFVTEHAEQKCRASTVTEYRRMLDREVNPHWGSRPAKSITKDDVMELLDRKATRLPKQSDEIRKHLRTLFRWGLAKNLITSDPTVGILLAAEHKDRERTLSEGEIRLLWSECERLGYPFGPLIQMLLATAQRRDEVAGATWEEFDTDRAIWTIPGRRTRNGKEYPGTKNGKEHRVHLSSPVLAILKKLPSSGLLFTTNGRTPVSGFSKVKLRLDRELKIAPWVLHDLRRSAATLMARKPLSVLPHLVDRILNYTGAGSMSVVARIYNREEYADEQAAALEAWGEHLRKLVDNVVDHPARRA